MTSEPLHSKPRWVAAFRALRHRNYRLFFVGQGISLIGTWMQQISEVWLAYRLTHSAWALGVTGFASQIPTFLCAPFMGAWVDRADKRKLIIWAQALAMVQAFALAALVLTNRITYPQLLVLSFFSGIIDALEIPSRQSFVIEMVGDPTDLSNAIALNSSLVNVARLLGPSVAGLLIAAVGEGWCFFINGVSYIAVIISLVKMNVPKHAVTHEHGSLLKELHEGFQYAAGSPPIAHILLLLACVSLMGSSYSILIPIFATAVLHGGSHTLGFLMGGSGFGALTGALYLAMRKNILGLTRVIVRGVLFFGTALFIFSFSHVFWLSWLAMCFAGFGMMSGTASMNTMLQTIADPDKRGRVMSFFTMAFIGMAPLGNLMGGSLAQHFNAPWTVRGAGLLCLGAAGIFALRIPHLREHIRPIYRRLGILPEVAQALQTTSATIKPRG